jgi:hypothetical protein
MPMMALWIFQLAIDAVLVGLLVWQWKKPLVPATESSADVEKKISAALSILDVKVHELEAETALYRRKITDQLNVLNRICDDAAKILVRGSTQEFGYSPSLEELELKTAVKLQDEMTEIPTIAELEKTKMRLKAEVTFDLKSLLRDQLA